MNLAAVCAISSILSLVTVAATPQDKPDFSGTWKLVEYRIGDEVTTAQGAMVGGAAVNCGQHCTITQTAESLTVSRTLPPGSTKPKDEVVFLDGRQTNQTTTTWEDEKLRVVRTFGNIVVTQTMAREGNRLILVSTLNVGRTGPYMLTYERTNDGG